MIKNSPRQAVDPESELVRLRMVFDTADSGNGESKNRKPVF